jgi:RNA polymerase sigma factor (sigma-70 family)
MATSRTGSTLRQIRTLFSLGRVGDRADGELLDWFETHHAEAEAAFEELVARHGAMVQDVCRRVLRDRNDVDDAFQATFLVLVRRAGSIRNRDALGGWLHRVALRVALRVKSEAAVRREVEQQAVATGTTDLIVDNIEQADLRTAMHEELDRIPASYRAAIVACHLEGLTHEEAANQLRWPVGTVRSRLARGRDRLRDRLARRGLSPAVVLPALARRPELVPTALQKLAAQSMCSYVAGHSLAGTVSAPVAALSERVIRAMNLRMLKIVAVVAVTIGAVGGTLPLLTMAVLRHAKATAVQTQRGKSDRPGSIAGVVRDHEGRPVEGATIVAGEFSSRNNRVVGTTGPDGRFAIQPERTEKLNYVLAYKEGLAPASRLRVDTGKKTPAGDVVLVLQRAELFVGTVRDRDGRPIVHAGVRIEYMRGPGPKEDKDGRYDNNPILANVVQNTPLEWMFSTMTDNQGDFQFPAVPAPQKVVLRVRAEGMADLSTEVPGNYEAGFITGTVAKPAHLKMEPEARVTGRVVTKLPRVSVAGLKIGLQSTHGSVSFWRDTHTDAEGRFEMGRLPEGGGNIFPLEHPSDGPWTYRAIDNLTLHPGKTAQVTIELIEGCLVEGKVADALTGDPVVGVSVGMYGPARPDSGAAIMSAKTDENGQYRFRLPPGKTQLYISSGPWPPPAQTVVVPADTKTFAVPTLKVNHEKDAEPAPKPVAAADKPIAKELQPLQGTWNFEACESVLWYTKLDVIQKTWRWEIHGQEITWTRQDKEPVKLSFTVALNKSPNPVAPNRSPNQIDFTFLNGPDKGQNCQGIYYFERGNLWVCMTEPGAKVDRPTKMAMSSDSKTAILILRQPNPAEPTPAKTSAKEQIPYREKYEFAGIVRDVSDEPIGGATVVGAVIDGEKRIDRQVVKTGPDGRFAFTLERPVPKGKDPSLLVKVYAFKERLAPVGTSETKSDKAMTLVLARTRPFACVVQDHDEKPIAGAEAWVQSIKAPVPEGQGMMVTEFSRPVLEGTPIEAALRATSDKKALLRLPSMPARSQVNLVVTAKGMRTHRTTDFTLPEMTGRWPTQFEAGFLHGDLDWPTTIYLDPGTEAKIFQKGRNDDPNVPDLDALTKVGDVAPDFTVTTLEGKRLRLSDLKGKVVLMNFFATWCGPCLAELPRVETEIWKPNQKRGLIVLAIGRDHTRAELTEFLHEHKLSFSIGPDPEHAIFKRYATESIPRNYVIGPDGRIAHQSLGYDATRFHELIEATEKEINALAKKSDG